jgi:uncharacterized membrane protein
MNLDQIDTSNPVSSARAKRDVIALPNLGEVAVLWVFVAAAAWGILLDVPAPLRVALGLPLVFLIPGYSLAIALFPARAMLDGIERIAVSVGFSLALISLLALGLEYSRWSLTVGPILTGMVGCTIVFSLTGVWRRSRLPESERATISIPGLRLPTPY